MLISSIKTKNIKQILISKKANPPNLKFIYLFGKLLYLDIEIDRVILYHIMHFLC